jgi:hypothetical protein
MRRVSIVLVLSVLVGCGKKPDRTKAEAACEHAVELGFMESEAAQGGADEALKTLAEMKKGPVWKDQVDKCTDDVMKDSSPEQVDCVLAAKNGADMDKCN